MTSTSTSTSSSPAQDKLNAVEKIQMLPCTVPEAFQLFTERVGDWWPLGQMSVSAQMHGKAELCAIEPHVGGRFFERSDHGEEYEWGRILEWNSPQSLRFTFHPGRTAENETEVAIAFTQAGDEAQVKLNHDGWEKLGENAQTAREQYLGGWDIVFGACFGNFARGEISKKAGAA